MKLKKSHLYAIIVCTLITIGVGVTSKIIAQSNDNASQNIPVADIQRFATVIADIKEYYIEPVTDENLFDNAIRGMLSNLDPHSAYLDSNDLRDLQTVTTGQFGGIGVEVMPEDGFIKVISPLDDTPASRAGIKPGDLIVRIDSKLVKDMNIEEAINMMRGKKGSKVQLTIIRKGETKPLILNVERDTIKVQSVKSKMLENGYGYIRIAFFQAPAKTELEKAVASLQSQSNGQLKGVVLDLRNNPGGLLDSAIDISNEFFDSSKLGDNKLIVYTKGRIPGADVKAEATGSDILKGTPMVVLINGGTASAAEILAGALQDHKRALIMGTRSFGKGSVQTVIPIDNQSAIKLTTALYYTPSGRSIQATGIEPDITVRDDLQLTPSTKQDDNSIPLEESDLQGHLQNGNGKPDVDQADDEMDTADHQAEKQLAQSDFQLYEALMVLKGLNVTQQVQNK